MCRDCGKVSPFNDEEYKCSYCGSDSVIVIKLDESYLEESFLLESSRIYYPQYKEPVLGKGNSDYYESISPLTVILVKDPKGLYTTNAIFIDNLNDKMSVLQLKEYDLTVKLISNQNEVIEKINHMGRISRDAPIKVFEVQEGSSHISLDQSKINDYVYNKDILSNRKDQESIMNLYMMAHVNKYLEYSGIELYDEDNIDNFIITERNLLSSPMINEREPDEEKIFENTKLFKKYVHDNDNLTEYVDNLVNKNDNLVDYISAYEYILNKFSNIDTRQHFTRSNIRSIYDNILPNEGMINTNLLAVAYFLLVKSMNYNAKLNIITEGKNLFKLFPTIDLKNRHIVIDIHSDSHKGISVRSPLVFDDLKEARSYCLLKYNVDKEEENNLKILVTDDIPETLNLDKLISSDRELMEIFLIDIDQRSEELNESLSEEYLLSEAINESDQRRDIQDTILKVFDALDTSGRNSDKYKNLFNGMNNKEFLRYIKNFVNSDENFYLEVLPNKNEPKLKDIKKALEILNVPLEEYVYFQNDSDKNNPVRTRYKVGTGYLHLKRLQQAVLLKNSYSLDNTSRSLKTGQVSGDDKVARVSNMESSALKAIGAENILKELMGARADSSDASNEMFKQISMYGYVKQEDLPDDISKKQTLMTTNAFLLGAGIDSDLNTPNNPILSSEE